MGYYFNGLSQSVTRFEKDFSPGYFYGFQTKGLFQTAAEVAASPTQIGAVPGDIIFVDVNGDGKADFIIGAPRASQAGRTYFGSVYVYGFCTTAKGDINGDGNLTFLDVVLLLNCTFLGAGSCSTCFSDLNCDRILTPADVVLELNAVLLGKPFPC